MATLDLHCDRYFFRWFTKMKSKIKQKATVDSTSYQLHTHCYQLKTLIKEVLLFTSGDLDPYVAYIKILNYLILL